MYFYMDNFVHLNSQKSIQWDVDFYNGIIFLSEDDIIIV